LARDKGEYEEAEALKFLDLKMSTTIERFAKAMTKNSTYTSNTVAHLSWRIFQTMHI
jgi:hypothetical protein